MIKDILLVGNCVDSFDEDGICINDYLPWSDVTEFAQAVDECDEITVSGIVIKYDSDTDIYSFFKLV